MTRQILPPARQKAQLRRNDNAIKAMKGSHQKTLSS